MTPTLREREHNTSTCWDIGVEVAWIHCIRPYVAGRHTQIAKNKVLSNHIDLARVLNREENT
jgi:hypothetical protein